MDNYVYIVAGLPELTSGFEGTGFDYAAVKESIMELLSEKDQQLVELMEEGFDENSLGAEFYDKAAQNKNRFIHHDIRPYDQLEGIEELDKEFSRYIPWMLKMIKNS